MHKCKITYSPPTEIGELLNGVAPHAHQPKKFIVPQNEKNDLNWGTAEICAKQVIALLGVSPVFRKKTR